MNTHRVCQGSYALAITAAMLMIASARAATIAVTNTNDNLAGSLRQAIGTGSNAGDTIVFQIPTSDLGYNSAANTFTITLTSGELAINKDLTIDGGSRQKIVVARSSMSPQTVKIFNVTAGTVNILNLTLQNAAPGSNC